MPTVAIVEGILILFYFNDHDPPHFHAQGADFHARIRIEDGSVLEYTGRMSPASQRRLGAWTRAHQAALVQNWHLARTGQPLVRIRG